MGYTHYHPHTSKREFFSKGHIAQLRKVLDYWWEKGVICYAYDQPNDPPFINSKEIRFNGKGVVTGTHKGKKVWEIGDNAHETFVFNLRHNTGTEYPNSWFCKTARKPYDQCVCEILILLREFLGETLDLGSDGDIFPRRDPRDEFAQYDSFEEEWKPAWDRLKAEGFKITWGDPSTHTVDINTGKIVLADSLREKFHILKAGKVDIAV